METSHENLLARWTGKLEDVSVTPLEFYQRVEAAVAGSEFPDLLFSNAKRREGGWLSPNRIYLRVTCKRLFFDISAIVVGNCLVVSWWLHKTAPDVLDLLAEIPGLKFILDRTSRARTYYTVDIVEHFQTIVHQAVLNVLRQIADDNKLVIYDEEQETDWEEIR